MNNCLHKSKRKVHLCGRAGGIFSLFSLLFLPFFFSLSVCVSLFLNIFFFTLVLRIAELLDGKGAATGGRFRGKVNKMAQRVKAEKLLHDHLATLRAAAGDCQTES